MSYDDDNEWQLIARDKFLPEFYKKIAVGGDFTFWDKGYKGEDTWLTRHVQKELHIDTTLKAPPGYNIGIDEKIVKPPEKGVPYTSITLEQLSNQYTGAASWMLTGKADILAYCMMQPNPDELNVYWFKFQKLKEWFWRDNNFEKYPSITPENSNALCRIIPLSHLWRITGSYHIELATGRIEKIRPTKKEWWEGIEE